MHRCLFQILLQSYNNHDGEIIIQSYQENKIETSKIIFYAYNRRIFKNIPREYIGGKITLSKNDIGQTG